MDYEMRAMRRELKTRRRVKTKPPLVGSPFFNLVYFSFILTAHFGFSIKCSIFCYKNLDNTIQNQ